MSLPNRIRLSTNASEKLKQLKMHTGLTPNILARTAIMLTVSSNTGIRNASVSDIDGLELNKSVLFGDHVDYYELLLEQYRHEQQLDENASKLIPALVEVGVHKLGHVKKISDLTSALLV